MKNDRIRYNCAVCNKKLPLFAIKCRCDKLLCNIHRYSEEHDCEYDYKRKYKEELISNLDNSEIKKQKINKI